MHNSHIVKAVVLSLVLGSNALSCNKPPEGVMGQELLHGSMGVVLDGYELRYIELQSETGAVLTTQEPLLVLHLTLTNHGQTTLRYDTRDSTTAAQQAQTPLLFVDPGEGRDWQQAQNHLALTSPGPYRYLADPVTQATVIGPGETIRDILLFECPPPGTTALVLSLPPSLFGAEVENPALIRISYAATDPVSPPVGSIGEELSGDGFLFRLDGIEVTYLPNEAYTGFTETPVLATRFTVRNTSGQALIYRPAHRDPTGETAPALAAGNHFLQRVTLANNQALRGQLNSPQTIPPNAEVQDMAVFERPDAVFNDLVFYFRGHNLGRTGQIRVRFPYTYLDPPLPIELMLPPPTAPPAEVPADLEQGLEPTAQGTESN